MGQIGVTELGYIGIGVQDAGAWERFAGDILGMEWADDGEGDRSYLRMDYWHHRIVMHHDGSDDLLYSGYRVAGPDEFEAMQRQLSDLGIDYRLGTSEEAHERRVLAVLKLRDPGGVPVEIFHGPEVDGARPYRPGRGMHGRFSTGAGGLGHIVIRDNGPDASYQFYTRALGMRGSVEARIPLPNGAIQQPTFLHCNERDHSVAFGAGPMRRRIHHLMVEVDSQDDVGLAYDLVRKAEVPLLMTLGKHANDDMLSFYVQTPSGWFLEYGSGGRKANQQSEYCTRDSWGHELVGMPLLFDL
ncbi:VOC family protein [Sphingomonas sp. YL-JM2C]